MALTAFCPSKQTQEELTASSFLVDDDDDHSPGVDDDDNVKADPAVVKDLFGGDRDDDVELDDDGEGCVTCEVLSRCVYSRFILPLQTARNRTPPTVPENDDDDDAVYPSEVARYVLLKCLGCRVRTGLASPEIPH